MADHFTRPDGRVPTRRIIAVGAIRRRKGRTTTVRATAAGVTGTITPARSAHGPQEDVCGICGNWDCMCPRFPGALAQVGGAR